MQLPSALFKPKLKKQKNPPRNKILLFREMELSGSNIKKLLCFEKWRPLNNSLYFRKQKPSKTSYILGNGTFQPKLED